MENRMLMRADLWIPSSNTALRWCGRENKPKDAGERGHEHEIARDALVEREVHVGSQPRSCKQHDGSEK